MKDNLQQFLQLEKSLALDLADFEKRWDKIQGRINETMDNFLK